MDKISNVDYLRPAVDSYGQLMVFTLNIGDYDDNWFTLYQLSDTGEWT